MKPLFHCDNDVTLQPCCVMFSHVRPLLVWVAWPVWEEEALLALSIVGLVVFVCKTLLRMYMLTSSDIAAWQLNSISISIVTGGLRCCIIFQPPYEHTRGDNTSHVGLHSRSTRTHLYSTLLLLLLLSTSHSILYSCQCPRTGDEGRKPTTAKQKAKTKSKK